MELMWNFDAHYYQVCERGATGADILVIDNSDNPEEPIVETSYIFPDVPTYVSNPIYYTFNFYFVFNFLTGTV